MSDIYNQNNLGSLMEAAMFNPLHSHMLFCKDRSISFQEWPRQIRQKPEELARNGFYYSGIGDKVVCFYCDVKLKEWNADDNIETEHGKWSPQCLYLKMIINFSSDTCQFYSHSDFIR